jgi:bifunctional non-homologous end joining protein LigD
LMTPTRLTTAALRPLLAQIDEIDGAGGNGVLELPDGHRLEVTNLGKVFWKQGGLTKGDLMRHDVRVAPYLLPVLEGRPLVMKRFPNGIDQKPFYQHRAPDKLPPGIRVSAIDAEGERRPHVVGGSIGALLYTAQLAAISQDPWFSRIGSDETIDHAAIDLDPPDGLPFARVRDVARWVKEALDSIDAPGFPKTSGAGGLHIYIPMPPGTPFEAGFLLCQIVATMVAERHPKHATIERSIKARGNRVYVDYMQNVRGKTLASAYSARASEFAGVSAPLQWDELETDVRPQDFTIVNFADRLKAGDLWAGLRKARGVNLEKVLRTRS